MFRFLILVGCFFYGNLFSYNDKNTTTRTIQSSSKMNCEKACKHYEGRLNNKTNEAEPNGWHAQYNKKSVLSQIIFAPIIAIEKIAKGVVNVISNKKSNKKENKDDKDNKINKDNENDLNKVWELVDPNYNEKEGLCVCTFKKNEGKKHKKYKLSLREIKEPKSSAKATN